MALHNILGQSGELAVEKYLRKLGYKILDTNWRTKWCEVDIVAKKSQTIHFIEVKYRASTSQGSGFEYINSKKLKQMARAAEGWVLINKWDGEYVLSAAEVSGEDFAVQFIEVV